MHRKLKYFALLCYRAFREMNAHHGNEMSGYLTFLSLLSLFPYTVLIVSMMGLLGQGASGQHLIGIILDHLPAEAVATLQPRIVEIISGPPKGLLTLSVLSALWTSSSAVEAIRGVLNRAYDVGQPPHYWIRRLLSVAQVLLFTLLVLVVMLVIVFAPVALDAFTSITGILIPLQVEHFFTKYFILVGAVALFGVVASFYYWLPNIKQTVTGVVPGALLVVALWIGGAAGVSTYLNHISQLTPVYGSLSGFIATLIFFYVMILIFIYGAEFNHQLMLAHGDRIVEKRVPAHTTLH